MKLKIAIPVILLVLLVLGSFMGVSYPMGRLVLPAFSGSVVGLLVFLYAKKNEMKWLGEVGYWASIVLGMVLGIFAIPVLAVGIALYFWLKAKRDKSKLKAGLSMREKLEDELKS